MAPCGTLITVGRDVKCHCDVIGTYRTVRLREACIGALWWRCRYCSPEAWASRILGLAAGFLAKEDKESLYGVCVHMYSLYIYSMYKMYIYICILYIHIYI